MEDQVTRKRPFFAIMLVIALGTTAWRVWPRATPVLRANVIAATAAEDTAGFARVTGPRPLVFPADHGPHDEYLTEWWYYTGNLTAQTGEQFGYQLTFFRRALTPPAERVTGATPWRTSQIYMAHLAISDLSGGTHVAFERFARGAAGLSGAQATPFRVWQEDWQVSGASAGQARLQATSPDGALSLDLTLTDLKGPILQGDRGYSRKGPEPGNASIYYSLSRLATAGQVQARGKTFAVAGVSWMDHEFSTSALGPELTGWDWFSIQLDDGRELMLYALRRADGRRDPFSSGTLIEADGSTRSLTADSFEIQVTGQWRSPRTAGVYPSGWIVTVPAADLRLTISPRLADQEMTTSLPYWEGAVRVVGTAGGQSVTGSGYVELTGYAQSLQGQF